MILHSPYLDELAGTFFVDIQASQDFYCRIETADGEPWSKILEQSAYQRLWLAEFRLASPKSNMPAGYVRRSDSPIYIWEVYGGVSDGGWSAGLGPAMGICEPEFAPSWGSWEYLQELVRRESRRHLLEKSVGGLWSSLGKTTSN